MLLMNKGVQVQFLLSVRIYTHLKCFEHNLQSQKHILHHILWECMYWNKSVPKHYLPLLWHLLFLFNIFKCSSNYTNSLLPASVHKAPSRLLTHWNRLYQRSEEGGGNAVTVPAMFLLSQSPCVNYALFPVASKGSSSLSILEMRKPKPKRVRSLSKDLQWACSHSEQPGALPPAHKARMAPVYRAPAVLS